MVNNSFHITLSPEEMPTRWYNFRLDLPEPLPKTLNYDSPVCSNQTELSKKFRPKALLEQDQSNEQWIDIPNEILDNLLKIGRPTPLIRARALEKYLDTPAKIYYKREDTSLTGSFKLSTAIAQTYYCKKEGFKGIVTETGAGQWGMAIALCSKLYGLPAEIFMAKCSLDQKPYRRIYANLLEAKLTASPSTQTKVGRALLKNHPNHPGSIGTAISDAIERALELDNYAYLSGSNQTHVLIHQSLLGLEVQKQLAKVSEHPDELIACVSGGSNFGGLTLPYLKQKLVGSPIKFVAAESIAAPRLTKGVYDYDNSDYAGYTPKTLSYTMGHEFIPDPIHVGGLRQHNGSPVIGLLNKHKIISPEVFTETEAFEAAKLFLHTEGLLVAPESSHAVAATINSALRCKKEGKSKTLVFLCSGNGFLDLEGYGEVLLDKH